MSTSMHRLQISLPEWQTDFLATQARKEGVSMAEVVRRLIQREAEISLHPVESSSLWDIAGIAEDHAPLIQDVPVSESPELYLTTQPPSSKRRR